MSEIQHHDGHEYERRGYCRICRLCGVWINAARCPCDKGAQRRREATCEHVRSEPTAMTGTFTCTKCGMSMGGYAVTSGPMYERFQRSLPR